MGARRVTKRKTFEQLALTRLQRRSKQIRKLIEDVAYDFFDSDIGAISEEANRLGEALDDFDQNVRDLWQDFGEREAADG